MKDQTRGPIVPGPIKCRWPGAGVSLGFVEVPGRWLVTQPPKEPRGRLAIVVPTKAALDREEDAIP